MVVLFPEKGASRVFIGLAEVVALGKEVAFVGTGCEFSALAIVWGA